MACEKLHLMGQGECDGLFFFSQMPCSFSYKITYKMDTRILSLHPLSSVTIFFFCLFKPENFSSKESEERKPFVEQ